MSKSVCPFCLNKTFLLKFSKNRKGKIAPMFDCGLCHHKIFITNTLAISCVSAWVKTLESLNTNEMRNLLLAGNNQFNLIKQSSKEMEEWSNSDKALQLTPLDILEVK